MNKRTFEILAKLVAEKNGVSVVFDVKDGPPNADLKNKVIHMPIDIDKNKVFAALALLMHEAAHLNHTAKIPYHDFVKDEQDMFIFNSIEDTRIDVKNYSLLPNVYEFYRELINSYVYPLPDDAPDAFKVLVTCSLWRNGFTGYTDTNIQEFITKNKIYDLFCEALEHLNNRNFVDAASNMQEIKKKIFNIPNKQQKVDDSQTDKGDKDGDTPGNQDSGEGKDGNKRKGQGGGSKYSKPSDITQPSKVWSVGNKLEGSSGIELGEAVFQETTKNKFKEILNMKENKIISGGLDMNMDNLTAYSLGDIDELFKDDMIVKNKKSTIAFLLDASSSMNTPLTDSNKRCAIAKGCVASLKKILDEVKEIEGINIDYKVFSFNDDVREIKDLNEYSPYGGTRFEHGFRYVVEKLDKDITAEGKKIVIVFSDGDVDNEEIDAIKKIIINKGTDIRCLIVGIGSDHTGSMAKKIVGDNIIFVKDNANEIVLKAIEECL